MNDKRKWIRIIYIIGIISLIAGALDPLEGSVIIAVGSALIALSTHLSHDRDRRIFLTAFIMIITGVCFMFYFSSSVGFVGESTLSWSWSTLILPYLIGWLIIIILLIIRAINNKKTAKQKIAGSWFNNDTEESTATANMLITWCSRSISRVQSTFKIRLKIKRRSRQTRTWLQSRQSRFVHLYIVFYVLKTVI